MNVGNGQLQPRPPNSGIPRLKVFVLAHEGARSSIFFGFGLRGNYFGALPLAGALLGSTPPAEGQ